MSCLKTGAVVYLESYRSLVKADIHVIGDSVIIHNNGESTWIRNQDYGQTGEKPTHYVSRFIDCFMTKDKSVIVLPKSKLKEGLNFI